VKDMDIPYGKLRTFREWLGINADDLTRLDSVGPFFTSRKEEFAGYFHDFFMKIPEAKFIIDHQERPGHLLEAWARWFGSLFSKRLDEEFLGYLWQVGLRHVEVGLDQRFSTLGFSMVREFCEKLIRSEFPANELGDIMCLVDKVVDFCILVETDAYIGGTSRCDHEIMKGIADRIRNPVTVIGGHINRLMKRSGVEDPAYRTYEFISSQSTKCEKMLKDIKTYTEIFEREPAFEKISLAGLITEVFEDLLSRRSYREPVVETDIEESASYILADPGHMRALFEHLIENSLEALGEKNPVIRVSARLESAQPHSLIVEIFNSGTPFKEEDMDKIFSPFYSTKPGGTGFGMSIAREAVRKNMGRLRLEPVRNEGTRVLLSLPLYE
jgi:hypothetical protein